MLSPVNYSAIEDVALYLGTGADTVSIQDSSDTITMTVYTGQGADVVTHHTDSTATVAVAEEKGKMAIAYHSDMRKFGPNAQLAAVTHHWGGALGAARDWHCSVRFDRATGLASAGGYVGDGVSTTHLAGRTLAALITDSADDEDRELVRLPWVGHRSRRWEPEPLRWIGVNAARNFAVRADAAETRTGRPSRLWGGLIERLLGH